MQNKTITQRKPPTCCTEHFYWQQCVPLFVFTCCKVRCSVSCVGDLTQGSPIVWRLSQELVALRLRSVVPGSADCVWLCLAERIAFGGTWPSKLHSVEPSPVDCIWLYLAHQIAFGGTWTSGLPSVVPGPADCVPPDTELPLVVPGPAQQIELGSIYLAQQIAFVCNQPSPLRLVAPGPVNCV